MNKRLRSSYTITNQKIGEGASGRIYKAYKYRTHQVCAVKIIYKPQKSSSSSTSPFSNMESKILKMLDHPNIIKVYDVF